MASDLRKGTPMVRSIEIPEPLFEADIAPRWDRENDVDTYHCKVLVGGKYAVFEKTYTVDPMDSDEDKVLDEFLAEFSERFRRLMGPVAL